MTLLIESPTTRLAFKKNDGGRSKYFSAQAPGDCVTRAIAIALGKDYKEVYDDLNALAKLEKPSKRRRGTSDARTGVHRVTYDKYLLSLGWEFVATMGIGTGCQVHLRLDELPGGTIIARVSKHVVAVIDGTMNDLFPSDRRGTRCVYGYYRKVSA